MLWLTGGRVDVGAGRGAYRADVALAGPRIAAFGRAGTGSGDGVVDLGRVLVLPGLVNAHDHLHRNCFPRIGPGRPYAHCDDWVADMAGIIERPAWRRRRAVPLRARVFHGALKNALAGATTVVHHDPWLAELGDADLPITVVPDIGWAHSVSLAGHYGPTLAQARAACPPGRPFYIHVAEGTDARAAAELGRLAAGGGLDADTRLIHGAGLTEGDVAVALRAGAGLVWCPASNDYLLGRMADPRPFAAAGRLGLGSDSRLSGSRDLLAELAVADAARALAPAELLGLVTGGAGAFAGRPAAGRLQVGGPADLIVLPDDGRPAGDQLVETRRADLRLVVHAGRPIVAEPDLAVVFDLLAEPYWPVQLDGRPRLLARRALAPVLAGGLREPGLRIAGPPAVWRQQHEVAHHA